MDNLELNKIKTRLEANQDLMRSALKKSTYLKVGGAIVGWDGMGWDGMGCLMFDCGLIVVVTVISFRILFLVLFTG